MNQDVLFVILDQYAEWEAAYLASALYMLSEGRYTVKTVSLTKEPVTSIGGFRVLPDYALENIPKDYAGLVLIGGMSWRTEQAKQVGNAVKVAMKENKVIGGICDAAAFLGTVGVLNNVNHTANDLNDLKAWAKNTYIGESRYQMQQAVRDNNVVTANGTAALEFAREVLYALNAASEKKIEEWYQFHKLGFYGAPMPEMQNN